MTLLHRMCIESDSNATQSELSKCAVRIRIKFAVEAARKVT